MAIFREVVNNDKVVAKYVKDVQLHCCATFGITIVTTYQIYIW
jgi:hypothetical protein